MTNPPKKNTSQKDFVQSAIRLPLALRVELKSTAKRNGRSFNAEMLFRLQASPVEEVLSELLAVKDMVRKVLDKL